MLNHDIFLVVIFIYSLVGIVHFAFINWATIGFTGKWEPWSIVVALFWPLFAIPWQAVAFTALLGIAALITYGASYLI